ncbi:MAG: CPBP family intramembrane glutamic endopeptidase [Alkalilacustris sp.]
MTPRHPEPFDSFVAPARLRPQLWRLGLGLALIVVINLMVSAGLFMALATLGRGVGPTGFGQSPGMMVALLLSFVGLAVGTWAAARLLHGRSLASLIGPRRRAARHFLAGAGVIALVYGVSFVLGGSALEVQRNLPTAVWLAWLPLALVGLAIQTGAEELALRGYVQSQLAARFASAWVWMVLPSAMFGLLHYDPAMMGGNAWLVVGVTGLFGLMAADLTARTGTLGLAWGLHFANNLFALLVVAPQGALSGLALFTAPFAADDTGMMRGLLVVDVAILALIWGLCRWGLRRIAPAR